MCTHNDRFQNLVSVVNVLRPYSGVVCVAGTIAMLLGWHNSLHPQAALFVLTTLGPYWLSTFYHFVPWRKRKAHDVALALDFLGISIGFSGQSVVWAGPGWTHANTAAAAAACGNVACTAVLGGIMAMALLRRARYPVHFYMRRWRQGIHTVNMMLLGVVETSRIDSFALNAAIQAVGKVFVPLYFIRYAAVDATRKGPLPVWPGVWSAHENWHCIIFALHLTQLYALRDHLASDVSL